MKSDSAVKAQAIQRHVEIEARRNVTTDVPRGPGNTSIGSIFDCNRKTFERMLRSYWDRLYVGWNPYKKEGRGCWEIWQTPLRKTTKLAYHNETTGEKIYTTEYRPNDFEHWVADLDYLSYAFIEKLKSMDSWENKNQVADHDYEYERQQQKLEDQEEEHLKYVVKHNKAVFRDLLDYTQSGLNPLDFFTKSTK